MQTNGIDLDNFPLPEVAAEALKKRNLQTTSIGDGITRISGHDGGVGFRFFIHPVYNKQKSEKAKYEVFDEHIMIEWLKDRYMHPTEQVRFLPEELLSFDQEGVCVGGMFKEAFDRFKNGQTAPGMPLTRWGVLSDGECATLAAMGIFSVEQFAAQPRNRIAKLPADPFVNAFERAILYMNGRDQRLVNEKQTAEMLALQEAMKAKDAEMAELKAMVKKLAAGDAPTPRGKSKPASKPKPKKMKPGIVSDDESTEEAA